MNEIVESKAIILESEKLTKDVYKITCKVANDRFKFSDGQFINIQIPSEERPILRAYSIASASNILPIMELCIKVVEGGVASNYLANLKEQDEITLKGPFGHFVLSENFEKDKIFIATGTGLAPLRGMILGSLNKMKGKIQLIFGARYLEDVLFIEENKALEQENSNYKFAVAVSRLEESSDQFFKGRVTDFVKKKISDIDLDNTEVYICGSKQMIQDVRDIFAEMGLAKENIFFEMFY